MIKKAINKAVKAVIKEIIEELQKENGAFEDVKQAFERWLKKVLNGNAAK